LATLHLKFLDFRLRLETNSFRAAGRLQRYFAPFLAPPPRTEGAVLRAIEGTAVFDESRLKNWTRSGTREPKESYFDRGSSRHILKNRTGMFITLSDGGASIVGDVDRHLNQVVNLANTLFGLYLFDRGYAMVHASAVARSGSDDVTIFMGNSGSGKSSLALYVIERGGFDYISNDRVLLKATRDCIHVVGLPKKPRVNPGTLLGSANLSRLLRPSKRGRYARMAPEELWTVEDKHDVDVTRSLGATERLDGYLSRCYLLDWRPTEHGRHTEILDAPAALNAFRAVRKDFGPFDTRASERDSEAEFSRIARRVAVSRVTGKADPAAFSKHWQTESAQ
jgi:HprK-related kinase B